MKEAVMKIQKKRCTPEVRMKKNIVLIVLNRTETEIKQEERRS